MYKYCTCNWNEEGMFEFVIMTCSRCGKPHPLAEMFAEEREAMQKDVDRWKTMAHEQAVRMQIQRERIKELEAEHASEARWAKTYCDAFVKVRDAAKEYIQYKDEMMTLGGGNAMKYYRNALGNLKQVLKDTENI